MRKYYPTPAFLVGDRQLDYALHVIAITQITMVSSPGRVLYDRKRSEGKTKKEGLRALK